MITKYYVFFTNLGYYSEIEFDTVEDAVNYSKSKGFETQIIKGKSGVNPYYDEDLETVGFWSYFSGFTTRPY